ncbi:MAG: sulfatase-like hydrolase/transferase, partial [Phycisphaerae bacterium]
PDLVNEFARDFVRRHKDKPFFLYYPMMLTHDPFQPTPDSKDWDPKAKGEQVNRKPAHFADMVAYMDKLVGKLLATLDETGMRQNTLVLFVGDNGTGKGVRSMMGERLVVGGKGATTDAGTHVPLIVNWPARITTSRVCSDLVDSTDFVPTICAAAGVEVPAEPRIDGRSFLPQLRGEAGDPRTYAYIWYSRNGGSADARECAFDRRFKLYSTGEFFDRTADPDEQRPLKAEGLDPQATAAHKAMQGALEQYRGARPAHLAKGKPNNAGDED